MNTCKNCNYLMEDHLIKDLKEFLSVLADMEQYINQGSFMLVAQTCDFHEVLKDTWYSDDIEFVIQCKKCNCQFICSADTYHGSGRFYKKDNTITAK